MSPRPRERGFSMLDALVALLVLALAFVPLMSLQAQLTRRTARQAVLQEQASAQRNALAVLDTVNPMAEPAGERPLARGWVLRWAAAPLTEVRRSRRFLAGPGEFDVALYSVDAVVARDERPVAAFTVEQVGWRRITPRTRPRRRSPRLGPVRTAARRWTGPARCCPATCRR